MRKTVENQETEINQKEKINNQKQKDDAINKKVEGADQKNGIYQAFCKFQILRQNDKDKQHKHIET